MTDNLHRYSVFVSSGGDGSLRDLQDVCVQMTWDAGQSAKARLSPTARSGAREEIQDADIFVRICREIDDSVNAECFWAMERVKPTLLLVLGPPSVLAPLEKLLAGAPAGSTVRSVSNEPYVFAKDYLLALARVVRSMDATSSRGFWAEQTLDQCVRNPFWRKFAARVNQWATLDWRFNTNAPLKKAAAEFFLDYYLDTISKSFLNRIFFESGSSIAFLSESFAARLDQGVKWDGLTIETNNILSYVEFVLTGKNRPITLYPSGAPEMKYGGIFGELMDLSVPPGGAYPIVGDAREITERLSNHFSEQYTELGLILAAISGLDLDKGWEDVGPHVGSYHNMLFKRALLRSGAPVVLFLDEDKLRRQYVPDQCFSVCDKDFKWSYVCSSVPLALVCAFRSQESASLFLPKFHRLGLNHIESGRHGEVPCPLIASNDAFWERKEQWLGEALRESAIQRGSALDRPATRGHEVRRQLR